MPENNLPDPTPSPEVSAGEFDFVRPVDEKPRVKRRSLKPAHGAPDSAKELAREAPPVSARDATPEYRANPRDDDDAETNAAVKMTEPAPATAKAKVAQPYTRNKPTSSSTPPHPSTSTQSTRPGTLYYSNGPSKETKPAPAAKQPEPASPMKTTPSASTASSTPASSTTATRPATTSAASVRPASVVDYRTNVERQSREQKSVGDLLSILVYSLIGLFVVGAILAGYGAYAVSKELQQQSLTVSELDKHYAAENRDLNAKLANNVDTLMQAQAQIAREQELIVKQQDTINKLLSATQDNANALRLEKQQRSDEAASLRARLKNVEYTAPGTSAHRY